MENVKIYATSILYAKFMRDLFCYQTLYFVRILVREADFVSFSFKNCGRKIYFMK